MSPTFSAPLRLPYKDIHLLHYSESITVVVRGGGGVAEFVHEDPLHWPQAEETLHVVIAAAASQGATVRRTVTSDQLNAELWVRRQISHTGST